MATPKPDVIEVKNGRLTVDVALTAGRTSASGKSKVFFSTGGNKPFDGYELGINLYQKV